MKRLLLAAVAAVFAVAAYSALPASAMPIGSRATAVAQSGDGPILVLALHRASSPP